MSAGTQNLNLGKVAREHKIKVHDPFAQFLKATPDETDFSISLLDCYHLSGHACHAITGAFLATQAAIRELFPDTNICERGDIAVEFGTPIDMRAAGPRSNVIGFITGAWGESGFPGLKGRFVRKGLLSFGMSELADNAVRFRRLSNGKAVVITYDPSDVVAGLNHGLDFPESWRAEISAILASPVRCLRIS